MQGSKDMQAISVGGPSPVEEISAEEAEEAARAVKAVQWALSVMADKRADQALYEMERQRTAHAEALVAPSWWSRTLESIGRLVDRLPDLQLTSSR